MEIKLRQLVNAQSALTELASKQLMAKTAFRIGRNLKTIASEIELCEKQRLALAQKYGTLDKEHNQYKFENGNGEKFDEELNVLLDTVVTLDIMSISLDDLADVKMASGSMADLDWLIRDESPTSAH